MKNKRFLKLATLSSIVAGFVFLCPNSHADYKQDQDIQKGAQQLKDADDAQKAADEREANRDKYDNHETSTGVKVVIGVVVAAMIVGQIIWFININPSKK